MSAPLISVLVIVYDMPRQAMNTLVSLLPPYQQNVDPDLYEIIVVENRSANTLDPKEVAALGSNVRYILRDEPGRSPAAAVNVAIAAARGAFVCLMIDGARMLTPGVLHTAAMAINITPNALVAVPGYHLGNTNQHLQENSEEAKARERAMLQDIDWQNNGYELFSIAHQSGANPKGSMYPFIESNCLFVHRRHLEAIGNADESFQLAGGGAINLFLFRQLCLLPETVLFSLPGEGSFHQMHGGVTTAPDSEREAFVTQMKYQLRERLGEDFQPPRVTPILLGRVQLGAHKFLEQTVRINGSREAKFYGRGEHPWSDEQDKRPFRNGGIDLERNIDTPQRVAVRTSPMTQIFYPPSIHNFEPKHVAFSAWIDHVPFGYDLVAGLRPKLLVELGTSTGMSYFGFCQSMKEHQIDGLCYAVDTWEGDAHTGAYDNSIYELVNTHNRRHYHGFSYLLRMRFDEAITHFDDNSIDLLHIDGFHTYEAVKEDFDTWYPKVKPGGIILFHDIQSRMKDFGVWKYWQELEKDYDETFGFNHGFGLGVLRKTGGNRENDSDLVRLLFDANPETQIKLRSFYVHASKHLNNERLVKRLNKEGSQGTVRKPKN